MKGEIFHEKTKVEKNARSARRFLLNNNGRALGVASNGNRIIEYNKIIKVTKTQLKQKVINDFEDGKFKVLCTAKALDEGFNVEGIEMAIICSGTSKLRNRIQRMGRTLRFKPGKVARVINLYIKDSQEESWLRKSQKGEGNIEWIDSIDQIL
jgi:superfamily II DNA or RNA helicase